MTSSIDEFDIPNDGDSDGACTSKVKGFVLHVDKCNEHDHWVHIHSSDKSEYASDTNTDITTGTNLNESIGGDKNESIGGDKNESIGGDKNESIGGDKNESIGGDIDVTAINTRFNSEVFVKSAENPGSFEACIDNGMVDINKLAAWIGGFASYMGKFASSMEERVSDIELKI